MQRKSALTPPASLPAHEPAAPIIRSPIEIHRPRTRRRQRRRTRRPQRGRAQRGGDPQHLGQRGREHPADDDPDRRRRVREVAGPDRRRRAFAVRSGGRFRCAGRRPPRPQGRRCRSSVRPSALRDGGLARARRPAARGGRGHDLVGGGQARGARHGGAGAPRRALGGGRVAGGQGAVVSLHAAGRQAGQVEPAGGQRLARAVRRGLVAGGRPGHRRQPAGLPDPRPHRRADRRLHDRAHGLEVRLGRDARPGRPLRR